MSSTDRRKRFRMNKDQLGGRTIFEYHYKNFLISLSLLREINEGAVKGFQNYLTEKKNTIQNELGQFTPEEVKEYNEYLVKMSTSKNPNDLRKYEEEVKSEKVKSYMGKFMMTHGVLELGEPFLREMILVYLIAIFENFLEVNLIEVFESNPKILLKKISSDEDKTISYKDLIDNIDGIKEHIAEVESKKILGKSLDEISKHFEYIGDLDLTKNADWKQFKEYFYRRHIIIHNNCFPDDDYCKKTGYSGQQVRLILDKNYLTDSFAIFEKYGSLICNHLNQKYGSNSS